MSEGTANALSREVSQGTDETPDTEPPRRTTWLTPASLAVTGGGTLAAGLRGDIAAASMLAAPILVLGSFLFFGVVCPAIWSRKPQRQKAALTVLTSLLGTTRRRNASRRRSSTD